MFDLIIRNGIIVDGTGADRFVADVAITDGTIVEIAPTITGEARRNSTPPGSSSRRGSSTSTRTTTVRSAGTR
ncbi:MAG: hypothetical protein R2705_05490 [Ilumatobacteraceae bacterium]